jgi:hypothetical protein
MPNVPTLTGFKGFKRDLLPFKALLLGLLLLLWGSPIGATSFEYTRHATPQSLTVGDIVDLQLTVTHQDAGQVTPNKLILPAAFLLRGTQYQREVSGNATVETWTYQLTVFETGKHNIPETQLRQKLPNGSTVIHKLPPIALNVVSLLPANTATVQGLKPLLDISLTLWPWLLGLSILTLMAWWAWQHYRTKQYPEQPVIHPPLSPKDEALAAINTLTTSGLMMRGEYDKVYTEITDILKRFLSRHYHQKMQEMTSTEVIQTLKEMDIDPWIHTDIQQLLAQADIVKFAHAPSSEEACYHVITVLKSTIVGIATIAPQTEGDTTP